jgi:hypothetical protein
VVESLSHLLAGGASKVSDIQDVGGRLATVTDPFGSILGIRETP